MNWRRIMPCKYRQLCLIALLGWILWSLFIFFNSSLPSGNGSSTSSRSYVLYQNRLEAETATKCCSSMSSWSCVTGNEEEDKDLPLPVGRLKVGFITYATGPYNNFVVDLWHSMEMYAFKNHEVHLFFFTDWSNKEGFLSSPFVHKKQQERLGWPFDSIARHTLYLNHMDWFKDMDFLISLDSDTLIVSEIPDQVLGGSRLGLIHSHFFGRSEKQYTYDRRENLDGSPYSTAYIAEGTGMCYFFGSLFGGTLKEFRSILEGTTSLAREDLLKNPARVALWHDESYLNKVFLLNPPNVVLSPNFMYPEPPVDRWLYVPDNPYRVFWVKADGVSKRFTPKIHHLGVRKHIDSKVDDFQAVSAKLPAILNPFDSSKEKTFYLPLTLKQISELVSIVITKSKRDPTVASSVLQQREKLFPGFKIIFLNFDTPVTGGTSENELYVVDSSQRKENLWKLVVTPLVLILEDVNHLILDESGWAAKFSDIVNAVQSGAFDVVNVCISGDTHVCPTASEFPVDSYLTDSVACWLVQSIRTPASLASVEYFKSSWLSNTQEGKHGVCTGIELRRILK